MPMAPVPTILYIATAAMLGLSGVALVLVGRLRPVYRGFWYWPLAQGLAAFGVLLHGVATTAYEILPLADLLLLQWPLLMLRGLRAFFPREQWRTPGLVDALACAAAFGAGLLAWAMHANSETRMAVLALAAAGLLGYATWLQRGLRSYAESAALGLMAGAQAATAVLLLALALPWPAGAAGLEWRAVAPLLPLCLAGLVPCLALMLTSERTERTLREANQRLLALANTDVLTAVPNRRHFHELAEQLLQQRPAGSAALLMCDIDHFKRINDRLGHAQGDHALRMVARGIRAALRANDVPCRLGGDEFVVLLPDASVADAMSVASRIVTQLEEQASALSVRLSLSFGVVQLRDDEPLDDALRRADQALYEAKRQGRKRAVLATGPADQPQFGESRPLGLHPL